MLIFGTISACWYSALPIQSANTEFCVGRRAAAPGGSLGEGTRIGNFVETKAATLEAGVKVNHLSYSGDAHVGANSNIGTVTSNYDGFGKRKTVSIRNNY